MDTSHVPSEETDFRDVVHKVLLHPPFVYKGECELKEGHYLRSGRGLTVKFVTQETDEKNPQILWKYIGDYKNDKMEGMGVLFYPDGSLYKGQFHANQRSGNGTQQWGVGITYEGQWEKDVPNGKGRLVMPNGDTWEGDFSHGSFPFNGRLLDVLSLPLQETQMDLLPKRHYLPSVETFFASSLSALRTKLPPLLKTIILEENKVPLIFLASPSPWNMAEVTQSLLKGANACKKGTEGCASDSKGKNTCNNDNVINYRELLRMKKRLLDWKAYCQKALSASLQSNDFLFLQIDPLQEDETTFSSVSQLYDEEMSFKEIFLSGFPSEIFNPQFFNAQLSNDNFIYHEEDISCVPVTEKKNDSCLLKEDERKSEKEEKGVLGMDAFTASLISSVMTSKEGTSVIQARKAMRVLPVITTTLQSPIEGVDLHSFVRFFSPLIPLHRCSVLLVRME